MLFIAHWLVIIVFWFYVVQLMRKDGLKIPLLVAAFWIAGYFVLPGIGLEGGLYFISYGAILSVLLLLIDLVREKMGLRKSGRDALADEPGPKCHTL